MKKNSSFVTPSPVITNKDKRYISYLLRVNKELEVELKRLRTTMDVLQNRIDSNCIMICDMHIKTTMPKIKDQQ